MPCEPSPTEQNVALTEQRDALVRELRRVIGRLETLSVDRLGRPALPWPTRAAAARVAAQVLADAAQDVEHWGRKNSQARQRREVPELADSAAPALVAVTGADLVAAVDALTSGAASVERVKAPAQRVADAVQALVALRRAL